jgi:TolA-binding protein
MTARLFDFRLAPTRGAPARGARGLGAVLLLSLGLGAGCVAPETRPEAPAHPLFVRAEQAFLDGREDEALDLFRSYRQSFGGSPVVTECHYWEGAIHLKKGRTGEAEASFRSALAGPRSHWIAASAWFGVGDCRFAVDDYEGAIRSYQRGLDLRVPDARNDYALYRTGVARQRIGDWEEGKSCYAVLVRDYARSALRTRAEQRLRYPDRSLHLQVGAFQSEDAARRLESDLHAKGFIARTVRIEHGAAPWLVWVGDYASVSHAQREVARVRAACEGQEVVLVP